MSMSIYRKTAAIITAVAIFLSMAIITSPVTVKAEGTSYYVDSASGNDSNDGKSESKPWKSLEKINSTTFQPGDKILLKCGSSWTGQLWPKGSGSEGKPIVIDSYGSGDKPVVNGGGVPAVIYLRNQEYWEIKNFEITNIGEPLTGVTPDDGMAFDDVNLRQGIHIIGEDVGKLNYIHITNMYIHDVTANLTSRYNGGIGVQCFGSKEPTWFNDLLIEGNIFKNVEQTAIFTQSTWRRRGGMKMGGTWTPSTNVVVRNNSFSTIASSVITIRCALSPVIEYNVLNVENKRGCDGMWPFNCDDAVMQYNEVYNIKMISMDCKAYDADWNSNRTIIQYNYSHDNGGGFALICCGYFNPDVFNEGTIVRYNISQNDLSRTIEVTGNTTNTTIYNNVFYLNDRLVAAVKPIQVFEDNGVNPRGIYFYNNIFYNEGMKGYEIGKAQDVVFDNNCWYSSYDEYAYDQPKDEHKIIADPQFVNPGSGKDGWNTVGGYKLKPTSPLINAGKVMENNGGKDYWGNPLYKGAPDIGVFEFQGELPPAISVKGKKIILKYAPELSGKTLLAFPGDIAKSLGMKYGYSKKTKTVTITKGKTKITMVTGSKTANVNGKKYTMAAAVKLNKVPLVPIQFLVEKLGYKYSYNSSTKIVSVK